VLLLLGATGIQGRCHAQPFRIRNDVLDLIAASGDSLDHNYVRHFAKLWSPRIAYERKFLTFGFHPKGDPNKGPQFYPNRTSTLGIGINFRELGVGFSVSLPNSDSRIKNLGLTKSLDFTINSYKARYGFDFFLYKYRGFFLAKPGLFYPESRVLKPYPQRSDVRFFQLGGNYFHIFNPHRFSFQAPYMFVKKQMRSAGSFLTMGGGRYTKITGDYPIDTIIANDVNETYAFKKALFVTAYILPGYAYTLVAGSWFANLTLFAGPGLQVQYYTRADKDAIRLNAISVVNLRGAAGYNGDEFFFGGQANFEITQNQLDGTRYSTRNDIFRIIAGFRL
jgi:hypothetical protein